MSHVILPYAPRHGSARILRTSPQSLLEAACSRLEAHRSGIRAPFPVVSIPAYNLLRFAEAEPYVTVSVAMAGRLQQAAGEARLQLCVLDGLRDAALQQAILDRDPGLRSAGYVAAPGSSRHENGEAVDITFLHEGRVLLLGSGFDQFSPASWRGAATSAAAGRLRAHLDQVMESVGMKGHAKEWWHYSLDGE